MYIYVTHLLFRIFYKIVEFLSAQEDDKHKLQTASICRKFYILEDSTKVCLICNDESTSSFECFHATRSKLQWLYLILKD